MKIKIFIVRSKCKFYMIKLEINIPKSKYESRVTSSSMVKCETSTMPRCIIKGLHKIIKVSEEQLITKKHEQIIKDAKHEQIIKHEEKKTVRFRNLT